MSHPRKFPNIRYVTETLREARQARRRRRVFKIKKIQEKKCYTKENIRYIDRGKAGGGIKSRQHNSKQIIIFKSYGYEAESIVQSNEDRETR